MDITMEKLQSLLTVSEVAELFEVPNRVVRKAAKEGTIPGAISVLDRYGFDPDAVTAWSPPEAGERKAKRDDGRRRYTVYLSLEEYQALKGQGFEVTDPREAAKIRRQNRKAAQAEGAKDSTTPSEAQDVFDDFA